MSPITKELFEERTRWIQWTHASLFHLGLPAIAGGLSTVAGRAAELSPAARQAVQVGLEVIDTRSLQLAGLRSELVGIARRQPACAALARDLFGVGPLTAVFIWAEMGDARRISSSDDAVRYAGLDITVYSSDDHRAAGHLARQGPGALRWALYEAAKNASRAPSPDHAYYAQARARLGAHRATLSVARKSHHILRNAGEVEGNFWSASGPSYQSKIREALPEPSPDSQKSWSERVPGAGIEPARPCGQWCLRPSRLPVPPSGLGT
jgi:transposase